MKERSGFVDLSSYWLKTTVTMLVLYASYKDMSGYNVGMKYHLFIIPVSNFPLYNSQTVYSYDYNILLHNEYTV